MLKLRRLLPNMITNEFDGFRISIFVFALLTAMILVRSCIHIFAVDGGAQSIATIPLDTFSDSGAASVVSLFALWGQSQLLLALVFVVVLVRYRSLIPLCYALLVLEWGGRFAIGFYKPIETLETAPGEAANLPIAIICLIMLALSLVERTR